MAVTDSWVVLCEEPSSTRLYLVAVYGPFDGAAAKARALELEEGSEMVWTAVPLWPPEEAGRP